LIDLKNIDERFAIFNRKYMCQFDNFWNRKLSIEKSEEQSILDDVYFENTAEQLWSILVDWNTYRNGDNLNLDRKTELERALKSIKKVYIEIKGFSLLEFESIPVESLQRIWNELGRVKEVNCKTNASSEYYVISICKPLMLLWGQTLAFDSKVRNNTPKFVPKNNRWSFFIWKKVMVEIQKQMLNNPNIAKAFELKLKTLKYSESKIVPYGRFLDIYFFNGPGLPDIPTNSLLLPNNSLSSHVQVNDSLLSEQVVNPFSEFVLLLNQLQKKKMVTGEEYRRYRRLWDKESESSKRDAITEEVKRKLKANGQPFSR
jgi:hypothetical protein